MAKKILKNRKELNTTVDNDIALVLSNICEKTGRQKSKLIDAAILLLAEDVKQNPEKYKK